MAACKAANQLYHRAMLPRGFEDLLNDMVRSIVATQPLDVFDHLADYLEALVDRRTLMDMQLERGKPQCPKSNIIKSETDKMETHEIQPCSPAPKRLNATRNLPASPSPKAQKLRPVGALGKPIRSNANGLAKRTPDVWSDVTVLASHLAQHEALRQVIKEVEDMNEQIIALEETAQNATPSTKKTRNTTQDLADKHSGLKRSLDKMMLISSWIKSNELSAGRSPETCEKPVEKTTERDVNQTCQGVLENQINALKDTVGQIQAALGDRRKWETSNSLGQENVLPRMQAMEQISSESRGRPENTKILDDIAQMNQWLQHMFQMLSQSEAQSQLEKSAADQMHKQNVAQAALSAEKMNELLNTKDSGSSTPKDGKSAEKSTAKLPLQTTTLLQSQTASSQNIIILTNTAEAKKADTSSPRKQKKHNAETDISSSSIHSSASSLAPEKQNKGSTAKHHQQMEARAEVNQKKETRINLQYYVNETDRKKETQVMLVSTRSRESHKSSEPTKPLTLESQALAKSDTTPDGASDTSNSTSTAQREPKSPKPETAQREAKSPKPPTSTDSRRRSFPVPLQKTLNTTILVQNASESELARLQISGKADSLDKTVQKEIVTDQRLKSQMTDNYSNVSNVDSYSDTANRNLLFSHDSIVTSSHVNMFCAQSVSSVSQSSWHQNETTAAKPKGKPHARKHEVPNNDVCAQSPPESAQPPVNINATPAGTAPVESGNRLRQIPAPNTASATNTNSMKELTCPSSEKIPHEPTKEHVLSNEIFSASFIKSSSYATANLSVQKGDASMLTKEKPDSQQPNVSSSSAHSAHSSSHSAAAKSSPPKGDTTKIIADATSEKQQLNAYSSDSFVKPSSHPSAKSCSHKVETTKPNTGTPSEALAQNVYSCVSFARSSSHATAKSDSKKDEAISSGKEVTPATPLPATSTSVAKTPSNSTAKLDLKEGDAGGSAGKEVISTNRPPNGTSTSVAKTSSHSTAKLSNQKGDVSTPSKETAPIKPKQNGSSSASSTKSGQASSAIPSQKVEIAPSPKEVPSTPKEVQPNTVQPQVASTTNIKSSNHSTAELNSQKANTTSTTKVANPESLQPPGVPSLNSTKQSSHSITKSGTQRAITSSAEPLTNRSSSHATYEKQRTPRYVDYNNIFPQISGMLITPETSQTVLSKRHSLSTSAKSLNKTREASHENAILSNDASDIERVKTQNATINPQQTENAQTTPNAQPHESLAHAVDPVETVFSKVSHMSMPKGSTAGATQAARKSKESIKLEETSPDPDFNSSTESNKTLPSQSHNAETGTEAGTEIRDPHVAAESNNNNTTTDIQQEHGELCQLPTVLYTTHRNVSEMSLCSFKMPEPTIQETNESEKPE